MLTVASYLRQTILYFSFSKLVCQVNCLSKIKYTRTSVIYTVCEAEFELNLNEIWTNFR